MNEIKEPDPLVEARQLFKAENYELSKKKLQSIKNPNDNIELNIFLTEHKINPANRDIVLNALMDTLTGINIKLFKDIDSLIKKSKNQENPIKYINHQYYYWNIIVIAQQIGKPSIASLIGTEALQYSKAFRTKTALMIIYQMLKQMIYENRLASCGYVVMKFKQIFQRAKSLTEEQQIYRAMNHIMWTKIFLRLGFLQESVQMYMLKVGEGQQKLFQTNKTLVLPFQIYRQFLHAQIQYFKQNYSLTFKILGDILNLTEELKLNGHCRQKVKMMVQNNIAIILLNMKKPTVSCRFLLKTNQHFRKQCNQGIDNERFSMFQRSKQNIIFSCLAQPKYLVKKEEYQKAYSLILKAEANKSYKFFYRKGQLCMNFYHQILKQQQKNRSYKGILDNSQCCYYYPNDPYFQSKGKNKNPLFNQGKKYYRRYQLSQWNCNEYENKKKQQSAQNQQSCLQIKKNDFVQIPNLQKDEKIKITKNKVQLLQEPIEKGKKRKGSHMNVDKKKQDQIPDDLQNKRCKSQPKEKQPIQQKKQKCPQLSELTFQAISYFKQSLALLQQQKKVIITFTTPENDLTERVNIKLYQDYKTFKQSILMNISYLYLCRQNWSKVLQNTQQYRKFVQYEKETNKFDANFKNKKQYQNQMYCILTYQMQAYCQLNRFNKAYEVLQDIIQQGYSESVCFQAISSINQHLGEVYLESTNQYHNLLYNITILHTRDNHLAESHQHLQKILTETNLLPNKYSFKTPLSVNDLLLYYQLRTYDRAAALQVIKRNRVMAMGGVNGVYHILNVTK